MFLSLALHSQLTIKSCCFYFFINISQIIFLLFTAAIIVISTIISFIAMPLLQSTSDNLSTPILCHYDLFYTLRSELSFFFFKTGLIISCLCRETLTDFPLLCEEGSKSIPWLMKLCLALQPPISCHSSNASHSAAVTLFQ